MKAVAEIFKLASRINIKPKDIIGMGGDIVKMGKSLFNTKVNPKLTEFINKKGEIPTKIVEDLKIHLRSLKNASETQVELFKLNLKDIVNAKFPKPVTSVKEQATLIETLTQNELKYLTEFINDTGGGKFTADIMSEVPSLRIIGNKITLNKKDINNFSQFLDDAYISDLAPSGRGVDKMPPRLRDATNNLLTKLLRSEKVVPETSVKELSPFKQFEKNLEADAAGAKELAEAFKGWKPVVIKGGKDKLATGGMAELNAELNQLPEYYLPMAKGGISNHFRKKFDQGSDETGVKLSPILSMVNTSETPVEGIDVDVSNIDYGIAGMFQGDTAYAGGEYTKGKVKVNVQQDGNTVFEDSMSKDDLMQLYVGLGEKSGNHVEVGTDGQGNYTLNIIKSFADGGIATHFRAR